MAIDALKQIVTPVWDITSYTAKQVIQHSPSILGATAFVHYGIQAANYYQWTSKTLDPIAPAKVAALICTFGTVINGFLNWEDNLDLTKLSPAKRRLITVINGAALGLVAAHYFKLKIEPIQALVLSALAWGVCNRIIEPLLTRDNSNSNTKGRT